MSTPSTISLKHSDGTIDTIYCHFDGNAILETLEEFYTTENLVAGLIALGDISYLGKYADAPEWHSFDTPADGCTMAYHRDRGDPLQIKHFNNEGEFFDWITLPYNYVFKKGYWLKYVKMGCEEEK